ncbi:hypothetical protein PF006_g29258 [Phytophthora fragariae]|uniref:Uncharacterized protein n=1 Tax=Phytophthora fragariae TaxID=53985 RepID=A0A6A3Q9A7_9STRA|nr:hypothetical protein PF006_g29258 [Phytophthora fragariae]
MDACANVLLPLRAVVGVCTVMFLLLRGVESGVCTLMLVLAC